MRLQFYFVLFLFDSWVMFELIYMQPSGNALYWRWTLNQYRYLWQYQWLYDYFFAWQCLFAKRI